MPLVSETKVPAPAAAPKVDEKKLEAMAKPAEPAPTPEKPTPVAQPEKPVDLSKADEKISSLLGGKK